MQHLVFAFAEIGKVVFANARCELFNHTLPYQNNHREPTQSHPDKINRIESTQARRFDEKIG
jgi:hypothetical protein